MQNPANKGTQDRFGPYSNVNSQANFLSYPTKREIPRNAFTITNKIASGNFGTVSKGELTGLYSPRLKTTVVMAMTLRLSTRTPPLSPVRYVFVPLTLVVEYNSGLFVPPDQSNLKNRMQQAAGGGRPAQRPAHGGKTATGLDQCR